MGYVEKLLAQEERIVFVTRLHWLSLLTTFLIDGIIMLVLVALVTGGVLLSGPLRAVTRVGERLV